MLGFQMIYSYKKSKYLSYNNWLVKIKCKIYHLSKWNFYSSVYIYKDFKNALYKTAIPFKHTCKLTIQWNDLLLQNITL